MVSIVYNSLVQYSYKPLYELFPYVRPTTIGNPNIMSISSLCYIPAYPSFDHCTSSTPKLYILTKSYKWINGLLMYVSVNPRLINPA